MALVLKDRVKETTTSTGTGTINLAGAATGFEGFVSAVGHGNTCYYAILDANGSAWEVGIGTVTDADTDTLSRDTILESSNSDNAISLTSGTHTVFLTYPADKSVYRNSNDQIVATASGIVFSDSTVQTTAPVDTNTTYTAGSGLQLDSTTFNAKTATTSASGITTLTNTIDSTQTKALTPKAVDDAGYGTMSNFILEDGDGTEVTIANGKEVKFVEGNGIDIDWTDVSDGSDSDPYDLTFTVDHDAASNFVANEHIDHTSVTLTAGSGLSGGGDISSNRTFHVSGVDTNLLQGTISSAQIANDAIDSQHYTDGSIDTAHIGDDQVTYAKIQHVSATDRILGRDSAGAGEIEEITAANLRTMINVADGATANVGDITSVVAGTGLSGGGTSADVTVNVSGVDTSLLQGTVPVSNGGTNATSLADKAVLITQDTGTDTVSAAVMDANGELLIGGTSGPAVATLTQGSNITITNADGGITVAADDAFLVNDADDTTTGTITAGGLSTTGVVTLGESTYQHKFDRYKLTGVTSSNAVAITLGGSALSDHYAYRIRCYDEDSSNLNGSVFLVRENNANNGWDVKTVSIQKNSSGEFPEVFDDSGTVKVKTGTGSARDIIVYIEAIFINRNDVTGFIWGGDHIWSKVTNAAGTIDNIYTTGNVGINTETPAYPLDVNGTGNFVGIRFSDGTTQTTADTNTTYTAGTGITLNSTEFDIDPTLISGRTEITSADADYLLVWDATDSQLKKVDAGEFRGGGGGSARSVAGDTDNGLITWVTSDNTFAAESSLTFDGTDLNIATGSIEVRTIDYSDGDNALTIADGGAVTFAKSINQAANTATDGGIVDIDCSLSNYHEILMNADATRINFTNVTAGQRVIVRFKQHSSHIDLNSSEGFNDVDVNGSNATIKWGGGVVPTLTETNNAIDVYGFIFESTVTNVMAFIIAQDVK